MSLKLVSETPPAGGEPTGRGSQSPLWAVPPWTPWVKVRPPGVRCRAPAPRPGLRRGPREPVSEQWRHRTMVVFPHKESFGLRFVWSLPQDLVAMGGPTRGIQPQTTELLGSLGHLNHSTAIRW